MEEVKNEEVTEEVTQETPTVEEVAEEQKPEVDLSKFESKDDDDVIKIDLSQPTETVDDNQTDLEEVIAEVAQEVSGDEPPAIEEVAITEEEVFEAIDANEETGAAIPENVQKLMDFMNETGGDLSDYVNLNRDVSELDNQDALREYYKTTKPHLDSEEINFLMEDNFSFDEDVDDERDIKRKKLALKEQVAEAKTYLDGQKSKYYEGQGYAGEDQKYVCQPDFIFDDLLEATRFIVNGYDKLSGDMDKYLPKRLLEDKENPVVVVGGLSRSGKSTLTSVIRKYLEHSGIKVKILKLDNWLLPEDQQTHDMDVRNRYQYDAVKKDIKALLNKEIVTMNEYDPKNRSVKKNADFISISSSEVLLIDGVIALDHEFLRGIADVSFFTYVPEEVRKQRFYSFYRYKFFSEEKIDSLYHQRIIDEVEIIGQSQHYAENNVVMDFSL